MSVINSMLRDLDRRHAPSPFKANPAISATAQPAPTPRNFSRVVLALCAITALALLGWNQHISNQNSGNNALATANDTTQPQTAKADTQTAAVDAVSPPATVVSERATGIPAVSRDTLASDAQPVSRLSAAPANASLDHRFAAQNAAAEKNAASASEKPEIAAETPATVFEPAQVQPIVKQERAAEADLNAQRYQLARNALAQNQAQRAYELLRDDPPPLAADNDYHAVLAAAEQQLGHYGDASLRYRQLLAFDEQQASWWLGLGLALEGEQRARDALAAYRRAAQLQALPEAAQQYVTARIAALSHSAEQ